MTKHNGRYYLKYAAPGTEYTLCLWCLREHMPALDRTSTPSTIPSPANPWLHRTAPGMAAHFRDDINFCTLPQCASSPQPHLQTADRPGPGGFDEDVSSSATQIRRLSHHLPQKKTSCGSSFAADALHIKSLSMASSPSGNITKFVLDENIRNPLGSGSKKR